MTLLTSPDAGPSRDPHAPPAGRSFLVALAGVPPLLGMVAVLVSGAGADRPGAAGLAIAALMTGSAVSLSGVLVLLGLRRDPSLSILGLVSLTVLGAFAGWSGLLAADPVETIRSTGIVAGAVLLGLAGAIAVIPTSGTSRT